MASPADRQRIAALTSIVQGVVVAILPFLVPVLFTAVPALASAVEPFRSIWEPLLPWLRWACWACGLLFVGTGIRRLLNASKRDRPIGTSVLPALQPLQKQGWQFQSSVAAGDQQTLAKSPQGDAFCIVVKAERGRIGSDGRTVFRLVDQSQNPFPVDFISQTKQRAARAGQAMRLKRVVPVLVFSDAIVAIDRNPVTGVHVVQAKDLRRLLLELS